MTVKFTNNASTTVATAINTTATSLVVASAAGFPALSGSGDYCYLTIQQAAGTNVEVVKATALSSNTFTIVRAQDGTSAGSWSVSDVVELRVTAALLTDIVDAATHDSSVLAVDSTNNRVGVNDTTPSVTLDISGTDAIALPVGTTAERPTGAAGRFRYNSSLSQFEGYTDAWGAIGGGGTNTFTTDTFTANGSLVAFNLSQTVSSENNLLVFIDGVFQTQDAYAIATASGTTTLTFSAAPANARKIVVYSVAAGISGSNLNIDSMTGDGSDVTLTLSIAPVTINNTIVTIDGVYQAKANYSISGTTLTFSTAPPSGTAVEVMTFTQTEINVPVDNTITSAKLSGDLTTPGALTVTGEITASAGIALPDSQKATFGASDDLQIYHDGNHSYIEDAGTGSIKIKVGDFRVENASGNNLIKGVGDVATLHHAGSEKLATTATGIDVTGTATATTLTATNGVLNLDDNGSHNGVINVPASLFINIDSDNGATGEGFVIAKDRTGTSGGTELFRVQEDGNVSLGGKINCNGLHNGLGSDFGSQQSFWAESNGQTNQAGYHINWYTGGNNSRTFKMKLDHLGSLLVGNTSVPTGGSSTGFSISDNGGMQMVTHGVSGTGNTYVNIYKNANGTVGGIRVSGSQTFFDGSSDQRLKDNIVDAPSASEDIDAIQVRSFNWKADNEHQKYGMIAQELATVAPIAVYQPEDPEEMQAVDYSKLVPMLVKEIQSLRSRVAELENN